MRKRRKFIAASAGLFAISGCLESGANDDGSSIQDSDGDGVIDSEDYAPNDPEVQAKSDVNGGNERTDDTSDGRIGASDPDISLHITFVYNGEWYLEYTYEGAEGEESGTESGSRDEIINIPGSATYVEAKVSVGSSASASTTGDIGLELRSGSSTVDSCVSENRPYPECQVEGRTQ